MPPTTSVYWGKTVVIGCVAEPLLVADICHFHSNLSSGRIRHEVRFSPRCARFLHGAPATGKLTVAKALLGIVPGRLFDNHVAIDVALTVFDFGAPEFWELVHEVRCSVIEAAAKQKIPLLVGTYCYSESDRPALEEFDAIVQQHVGELLPVYLHCNREEVILRLNNPDRARRGKITSAKTLDEFSSKFEPAPAPRQNCLTLDSGTVSADEMAKTIVCHFGLA
jgi:hypothetical protein